MKTYSDKDFVEVVDPDGNPVPGFEAPVPSAWVGTDLLPPGTKKKGGRSGGSRSSGPSEAEKKAAEEKAAKDKADAEKKAADGEDGQPNG